MSWSQWFELGDAYVQPQITHPLGLGPKQLAFNYSEDDLADRWQEVNQALSDNRYRQRYDDNNDQPSPLIEGGVYVSGFYSIPVGYSESVKLPYGTGSPTPSWQATNGQHLATVTQVPPTLTQNVVDLPAFAGLQLNVDYAEIPDTGGAVVDYDGDFALLDWRYFTRTGAFTQDSDTTSVSGSNPNPSYAQFLPDASVTLRIVDADQYVSWVNAHHALPDVNLGTLVDTITHQPTWDSYTKSGRSTLDKVLVLPVADPSFSYAWRMVLPEQMTARDGQNSGDRIMRVDVADAALPPGVWQTNTPQYGIWARGQMPRYRYWTIDSVDPDPSTVTPDLVGNVNDTGQRFTEAY